MKFEDTDWDIAPPITLEEWMALQSKTMEFIATLDDTPRDEIEDLIDIMLSYWADDPAILLYIVHMSVNGESYFNSQRLVGIWNRHLLDFLKDLNRMSSQGLLDGVVLPLELIQAIVHLEKWNIIRSINKEKKL